MELTYTRVGDYYIPNLVADEPESVRDSGQVRQSAAHLLEAAQA